MTIFTSKQGLVNVQFWGFVSHHLQVFMLETISPIFKGGVQVGHLPTPVACGDVGLMENASQVRNKNL